LRTLKLVPFLIVVIGWMFFSPISTLAEGDTSDEKCEYVNECIEEQNENQVNDGSTSSGQDINTFTTFLKFLFALVLIIFLIYWLLKFINKQTKAIQNNHLIQSLGGVGLGPNRSVQVVKIGKKVMVLGVGEDVQLLGEISDEAEVEEMLTSNSQGNSSLPLKNIAFSDVFNKIIQQQEKGTTFKKTLDSQLTSMKEKRQELFNSLRNKGDRNE
jgi:flagellar protein FliO/FliZ